MYLAFQPLCRAILLAYIELFALTDNCMAGRIRLQFKYMKRVRKHIPNLLVKPFKIAVALALGVGASALPVAAAALLGAPSRQADKDAFFEAKIRPLLVENCFVCHSVNDQKGGLRLDSRAAILKGGGKGSVVTPGDPDHSAIIRAIAYDGPIKMPPAGKLTAVQIAALTEWVKAGAVWPEQKTTPIPT